MAEPVEASQVINRKIVSRGGRSKEDQGTTNVCAKDPIPQTKQILFDFLVYLLGSDKGTSLETYAI